MTCLVTLCLNWNNDYDIIWMNSFLIEEDKTVNYFWIIYDNNV